MPPACRVPVIDGPAQCPSPSAQEAIVGDYALVKAWKADTRGNLVFRGTARNFNCDAATAGKICIAEVVRARAQRARVEAAGGAGGGCGRRRRLGSDLRGRTPTPTLALPLSPYPFLPLSLSP